MTEDLKSSFVAELGRVLRNYTRTDVMSLLYSAEGSEEYVEILFINHYTKKICVTGDSCLAIMHDVYRALI
jgi:hypothetical protein